MCYIDVNWKTVRVNKSMYIHYTAIYIILEYRTWKLERKFTIWLYTYVPIYVVFCIRRFIFLFISLQHRITIYMYLQIKKREKLNCKHELLKENLGWIHMPVFDIHLLFTRVSCKNLFLETECFFELLVHRGREIVCTCKWTFSFRGKRKVTI